MARFRTEGLDELIEDMARMGLTTGELADKILFAGAEEIKKSWKAVIKKHNHIDTGAMLRSVGYPRKIKKIRDIKSVDIYPQGTDRRGKKKKGVKNATKAFVLHYGTSKIPASHFVDDVVDIAGPSVEHQLRRIFDDWLQKHNML